MSLRVLIFDGDSPLASAISQVLFRMECDVVLKAERSSFMAAAIARAPDLIIFAHQPGRTEAFSICLATRRDPSLSKVPTVLASTYAAEAEFEKHGSTKSRADAYFASVTSAEALVASLGDLVPELHLAPPSGQGIEVEEEGFANGEGDEDDDNERTVVGRLPLDFFAPKPVVETADRPTVEFDEPVFVEADVRIDLTDMPEPAETANTANTASAPVFAPSPGRPTMPDADEAVALGEGAAPVAPVAAAAGSTVSDREFADLQRTLAEAKAQVQELRAQLVASTKGPTSLSMKEFLDLREQIGKRDWELLTVREELTKKDRELFDERDRSLAAERARDEADDAIVQLTKAIAEASTKCARLAGENELHAQRAEDVSQKTATAFYEEKSGADERFRLAAEGHREALLAAKNELAASDERSDFRAQEVRNAEALVATREGELTTMGAQRAAADVEVARLREEVQQLAATRQHELRALQDERAQADEKAAAQAAAHAGELATLRENAAVAHAGELATLRENAAAAHAGELATLRESAAAAHAGELATLRESAAAAHAGELATLRESAAAERGALEGERDEALQRAAETSEGLRNAGETLAANAAEAHAAAHAAAETDGARAAELARAVAAIAEAEARNAALEARALSIEAEANGLHAECTQLKAAQEALAGAHAGEIALRHDGMERARDALAVALAELDALPLGERR